MSIQVLNPAKERPASEWPGSQHEASSTLFPNHPIKTASGEALKGLHAKSSTTQSPASVQGWNYIDGPRVSIVIPKVAIAGTSSGSGIMGYITYIPRKLWSMIFGGKNKFAIPSGEYLLINRANRAPLKDKWQLGQTYEFPGRAYKLEINSEIKDPAEAAALTATHELGIDQAQSPAMTKLAENVSASAGNSSLIYDFYSTQIQENDINKLIEDFGADLDTDTGVVSIHRKCDGGIIDGIELIPVNKMQEYLKQKESDKASVAASTYAALKLLE